MRVVLVGRPNDRDRVRHELLEAGFEIVAEAMTVRQVASLARPIDAIVTATADRAVGLGDFTEPARGLPVRRPLDDSMPDGLEPLTAREHDVLALLVEGASNKAIAHALGISDQTVKFHVAAIAGKLGAANRTDTVRRAIRRGLVAI